MAQTPACLLDGGPYKVPFGECAIYSQSTVHDSFGGKLQRFGQVMTSHHKVKIRMAGFAAS